MSKKFEALAAGGKVTMPLQDTFWGADVRRAHGRFRCPFADELHEEELTLDRGPLRRIFFSGGDALLALVWPGRGEVLLGAMPGGLMSS